MKALPKIFRLSGRVMSVICWMYVGLKKLRINVREINIFVILFLLVMV
jgi:hypothetical protein